MSHIHQPHNLSASPVVKDPVCGMDVDPATSEHRADHDGATYFFCSAHCKAKFIADPAQYTGSQHETVHTDDTAGTEYTCPMHPEIRQMGPGACPICGMALEPVMVTADTGPSHELKDMTRRFWVAVVLSVPVVILEMGGHLFPV